MNIEAITPDELEEIFIEGRMRCYEIIIGREYMTEYYMITGKIAENDDEAREYVNNFHNNF